MESYPLASPSPAQRHGVGARRIYDNVMIELFKDDLDLMDFLGKANSLA